MARSNRSWHADVLPACLQEQRAECESRMCAHDNARALGLDDVAAAAVTAAGGGAAAAAVAGYLAGAVVRTVRKRKAKAKAKPKTRAKAR